ncbi:3',5'-bisphosphate nucleotidase AHL [Apium graveolens]|uniref:3',5'-bisphosphate nucleotidase AHL n=1 Tax=Apium graveolens TaxID=4045 RepID=UPI003D793E1E
MENDKYAEELDVGVKVVQMACSLCKTVQKALVSGSFNQVKSKNDDSPVTVADWSVQATVSWMLCKYFGSQSVSIIAEEDVQALSETDSVGLLEMVVNTVNETLAKAPTYGLNGPGESLRAPQVLEAIGRCNSSGGPVGKHWVLDPVDGTLGFIRGDQYAVALALIDNGKVVVGVLGCPNYPLEKESLNYHNNIDRHTFPSTNLSEVGCVIFTRKGSGEAWMQPLIHGNEGLQGPNRAKLIKVSSIDDPSLATFCESVEGANTNHSFTAGLANGVGLRNKPLRVHSMVKYAAIARGDAEIYMKFAKGGYKEKIWDHAAGVLIVQEAGGVVTDAGGRPLNFSRGMFLEGIDRGIVACSGVKMHEKIIGAVYASWDSSNL